MDEERIYIEKCKEGILAKLSWKESKPIKQRDYEHLSEEIFNCAQVRLSTTTLRRIWRNDYNSLPQVNTLNALAIYLECSDWNDFKNQTQTTTLTHKSKPARKGGKKKHVLIATGVISVIFIAVGVAIGFDRMFPPDKPQVSLSTSQDHFNGVPATIGFDYDIHKADKPVEIELSWNPYERTLLKPSDSFYTGVYYYPDYHRTKLLSGDEVLLEIPVYVTTDDWHANVMRKENDIQPIFIDKEDYLKNGQMGFDMATLKPYLLGAPELIIAGYTLSNMLLGQFKADNFTLNTVLKSYDSKDDPTCKKISILIKAENGLCYIPIIEGGCYGHTGIYFSERVISGKNNDLSALTTNLHIPNEISLEVQNGQVTVQVGENSPFILIYENPLGTIKVVKLLFEGLGSVDQFSISGNGNTYKEDFDNY